jgi:hypothetical protein
MSVLMSTTTASDLVIAKADLACSSVVTNNVFYGARLDE